MFLLRLPPAGAGGCLLDPDSHQWPEWPPIMTDELGDFILPTGVEDHRKIALQEGQVVATGGGRAGCKQDVNVRVNDSPSL